MALESPSQRPKVLFINNVPFSDVGSNGKTFLSLFFDFDSDSIIQLYFNDLQPYPHKFTNCFKITDKAIVKSFFLRQPYVNQQIEGNTEASSNIAFQSLLRMEALKRFVRNTIFLNAKIHELPEFDAWIQKNRPSILFLAGAGYYYSYKILADIAEKYKIPYYIYFGDDYFIYNRGNNIFDRISHYILVKKAKPIIEKAEEIFVISPKMKIEYEHFFNQKATILINAVEAKEKLPIRRISPDESVFKYFGFLHSGRAGSLNILGKALQNINIKLDKKLRLEVYTLSELTSEDKTLLRMDSIRVCAPLSGEALKVAMINSDFLVHAESFEPQNMQVTMLSISTKIPEYLASNRCVIAIGPPKLASVSIFKENNLGIVLEQNPLQNESAIINVLENFSIYEEYCNRATNYFNNTFNAKKMRSELKNKLSNH